MTWTSAPVEAFAFLARAIPRLGKRWMISEATVELLVDVFETAAARADTQFDIAEGIEAAHRFADMVGKKGGVFPGLVAIPTDAANLTPEEHAALAGYAAAWATIGAITAGKPLPVLAEERLALLRQTAGTTQQAVVIGNAHPGRRIPRSAPLSTNPFVATLQERLGPSPRGQLRIVDGVAVWGDHDPSTLAQIDRCADDERVIGAAICADGHKGYAIPIGGVLAYHNAVSPNGVGFDIGCGVKAVRTDMHADDLVAKGADGRTLLARVMDDVQRNIAFGVGRTSGESVDHPLFDEPVWQDIREIGRMRHIAQQQLGTVGGGNHFVDVARDDEGNIWVVCHFGSRGLGHKTATGFLNLSAGRAWDAKSPGENMDGPAIVLSLDTDLGQSYMQAMRLGGRYAHAGRDFVAAQVVKLLGASVVDEVHMHHNYAFEERHGGQDMIVVRKGSTPAQPGMRGIIAGSMGTPTAIVRGLDGPESAVGFYSAPHGSGRVMSSHGCCRTARPSHGRANQPRSRVARDAARSRHRARHRATWGRSGRKSACVPQHRRCVASARWNHRGAGTALPDGRGHGG